MAQAVGQSPASQYRSLDSIPDQLIEICGAQIGTGKGFLLSITIIIIIIICTIIIVIIIIIITSINLQ